MEKNIKYLGRRVAIIAAMSATGETGGAERFYYGLLNALIEQGCDAVLVPIAADESTFDKILENYRNCDALDLSDYDLVISTKAPTYAVKHARHVLYLMHTTRVFYDMFDEVFPWAGEELAEQRQKIIKLDTDAIGGIKKKFSIGYEVTARLKKWNNLDAEVLHPPLGMNRFEKGEVGDYFFMPGRLHSWKRVHLAISAIKDSKLPMRLLIAGTGEAETELKLLCDGDSRIEFLGRVSDDELINYYSNALAVPFIPLREDFGYVTLEAFSSSKAVITCTDSGEPLHFVDHQNTGLVCEPTPQSIRAAMEHLFLNKDIALTMGKRGAESISHITWPQVAQQLLSAGFDDAQSIEESIKKTEKEIKVTVIDMQPIDPPVGGGRLRLLGLYHALGHNIVTRYVGSYDWPGEKYRRHYLTPNLEEIDVPLSDLHHAEALNFAKKAGDKGVIDISFPRLAYLSPEYLDQAREAIKWADVVIFSHPWAFPPLAADIKPETFVVYDSQNVEGLLRAQLLDESNPFELELIRDVVRAEYEIGTRASLILACSTEDRDLFNRVYGWAASKLSIVPNGVMASKITPPTISQRALAKQKVGLSRDSIAAIFIGSDYQPNAEAVNFIVQTLAVELPSVKFVVAGGIGARFKKKLPPNVIITGSLNEEQKLNWLQAADIAINPMFSGSGTNIKMFDFMASGLPVVATAIGARGITTQSTDALIVASSENFTKEIHEIVTSKSLFNLGKINRECVEKNFAWESISPQLGDLLRKKLREQQHKNWDACTFVDAQENDKLRLAHLCTAGHKCGIGEYTVLLAKNLAAHGVSNYAITCNTPNYQPDLFKTDIKGEVGWFYDDVRWCESEFSVGLVKHLKEIGTDAVLIQYHPAFYSAKMLENFIAEAEVAGIRVAVTLHNFILCDTGILRRLSQNGVTFFSHSRQEIASAVLENINLSFLPFGIEALSNPHQKSIEGRDWIKHPPVIATTGFIRPHKGIPSLIKAIALLREEFPGIKLILQCSLYPSDDSQLELTKSLAIIEELGLQSHVVLDTEFYPIAEVYKRLSNADLAVLPYAFSNEGGSAAAATCLGSGLPLIVSKSLIFEELRDAALTLEDNLPESIAQAISETLNSQVIYKSLTSKAMNYGEKNSWNATSNRVIKFLTGTEGSKIDIDPITAAGMLTGERRFYGDDDRLQTQVGSCVANHKMATTKQAGYLLYGPYIALSPGQYRITIRGEVGDTGLDYAGMDVVIDKGSIILAQSSLNVPSLDSEIGSVKINVVTSCSDLEVRVWVNQNTELQVTMIEIAPWQAEQDAGETNPDITTGEDSTHQDAISIEQTGQQQSAQLLSFAPGATEPIQDSAELETQVFQQELADCSTLIPPVSNTPCGKFAVIDDDSDALPALQSAEAELISDHAQILNDASAPRVMTMPSAVQNKWNLSSTNTNRAKAKRKKKR